MKISAILGCLSASPRSLGVYLDLCLSNLAFFRKLVQTKLGVGPFGEGHQAVHQPSPLPGCGGPVNGVPLEVQLPHTTLLHRLQQAEEEWLQISAYVRLVDRGSAGQPDLSPESPKLLSMQYHKKVSHDGLLVSHPGVSQAKQECVLN